jgi:hypothetical protein
MPPETERVPVPKGYGVDAMEYLEAHGLMSVIPTIRSSDWELLGCPFRYYLRRRLGLADPLEWIQALMDGGWFHKWLEFDELPEGDRHAAVESCLLQRQEELLEVCSARGVHGTQRQEIVEREEHSMLQAKAWYEAMMGVKIPNHRTVRDYFEKPFWQLLGREVILYQSDTRGAPRVAQLDALYLHTEQRQLYVLDAKTCAEVPEVRLQTCPIEFQTQHYLSILQACLDDRSLWHLYPTLPADVTLGGMIHVAVQKPTISFGMMDRPFEEYEHTISRGTRKGEVDIKRRYMGEPRYERYLERVREWYFAYGRYEENQERWKESPPVNMSVSGAAWLLDGNAREPYNRRLDLIHSYATRRAIPAEFPMRANHLRRYGKLSPLAPFYLTPASRWPDIVMEEGLIQAHRDSEIVSKING